MSKKPSHPNFGRGLMVRVNDSTVTITFEANTPQKAAQMFMDLKQQIEATGGINITITGDPTAIFES